MDSLSPGDLYSRAGLVRLDGTFVAWLETRNAQLVRRLLAGRADPAALDSKAESQLIVALAPLVETFIVGLFGIQESAASLCQRHHEFEVLFEAKRKFVQRYALRRVNASEISAASGDDLRCKLEDHLGAPFDEITLARRALEWLSDETGHADALDAASRFAAWAVHSAKGRHLYRSGVLFRVSEKRDPLQRIAVSVQPADGVSWLQAPPEQPRRQRRGFALSDEGYDLPAALAEAKYCIFCHNQGKDTCSSGMRGATGVFQTNAVGALRVGCPLGEKISEMHEVRVAGHAIAALAIVCIDNPMAAGTGHRICNDCMVSCIYQNQNRDPVDIPQSETRILKDVLELPWGFEIYSLLTRWNPLSLRRPVPRPASGRTVLVVGMGPAGYTLAHHLMNDGHAVVAIDGLKIEPLSAEISGRDVLGQATPFRLIRDASELRAGLDRRVNAGFGGVAEYGITVRWDKNFLNIIRLLLERRDEFALYGGVRFGGTLTLDTALALGFDHIALCNGAGRPTVLDIPNGFARGVRTASDFLMALQLTGAARDATLANLQVRLPVLVIGGGLTAIDTCTEALAYYPVQVEKFLSRYERLSAELGETVVRAEWNREEALIADEFLAHARMLRSEREAAQREGREPEILALLTSWGGARIVYRRRMIESPAYRNHEEIAKALEEGIAFGEQLTPVAVEIDEFGHARGLRVRIGTSRDETVLPARAILIAAGTTPNTVLAREDQRIQVDGKYFQAMDERGTPVSPERCSKPAQAHVLAMSAANARTVSFFGDLHPSFAGNVVAAMASAQRGYPVLSRMLATQPPPTTIFARIRASLDDELHATVVSVRVLTQNIVELVVRAPRAAREFRPGQFYRLQNFESLAPLVSGTRLAMEGLALTGAWVDDSVGEVGLIVLEMGGSSNLCRLLKAGDPVILMGPTGEPTEIRSNETVLLAGGGLGNAVLFSIGRAFRAAGSRVLYFAGYRTTLDCFRRDDLESAADAIVWCVDQGPHIASARAQDRTFVGNIVEAMVAFAEGRLGTNAIRLAEVDRIIAIGSDRMMAAVKAARHGVLAAHLKRCHRAVASVNSPMQCMMKEICGQCLQVQRDSATGQQLAVFTCFNQDQDMDRVDFQSLRERLGQNAVQEKLTKLWIRKCVEELRKRSA
jgi:NADPH-dependent glutamate synthase beta subunit-like oxidoreductase/NAD(P)H-flavin reductase